ncbi:hypothetical protein [Priestia endophytica]|uniref:Uncharacterized protein n=1 Tax=Priestia endophytica TaxID=135735 RepID=A0AAX1QDY5_9BACI|nr:hypothetical protein [Priestia endophytica]RAS81990.1 hypothetical protein A3864_00345 [Priestia endophytica]RAS84647.1 hypothetical protein A3863_25975 [Priestia endophytica]
MGKITLEKVVKQHWNNFSILSSLYSLSEKTEWDYKEHGAVIEALRRIDSTLEKKQNSEIKLYIADMSQYHIQLIVKHLCNLAEHVYYIEGKIDKKYLIYGYLFQKGEESRLKAI